MTNEEIKDRVRDIYYKALMNITLPNTCTREEGFCFMEFSDPKKMCFFCIAEDALNRAAILRNQYRDENEYQASLDKVLREFHNND